MELNHVLLFTVVATSALILLQAFQPQTPGARARAGIVLIASALCWLLARSIAGWLSAIIWCALLMVPAFLRHRAQAARFPHHQSRRATVIVYSPIVLTLIIINIAVFILELLAGGSTNELTLHRLGELDTSSVIYRHAYWRLFAALFLHYGPIHIFFNLFALLLGPPLERQIGGLLFFVCYAASGLGSSIAVVLLTRLRLLDPVQLVGASGCIMGVVGTWAGFSFATVTFPSLDNVCATSSSSSFSNWPSMSLLRGSACPLTSAASSPASSSASSFPHGPDSDTRINKQGAKGFDSLASTFQPFNL